MVFTGAGIAGIVGNGKLFYLSTFQLYKSWYESVHSVEKWNILSKLGFHDLQWATGVFDAIIDHESPVAITYF